MELNTITLSDFTALADVKFEVTKEAYPMVAQNSGLFKVESVPDNTGDKRTWSEIDLEEFASTKREGESATRARVQQGYSKTGQLKRFAKDIEISYEMRRNNKYPEVIERLTSLGEMGPKRLELDLTHRLTFGTATTLTNQDGDTEDISCGDSLALFYTAHTLRGSSTTYRNILANNPQLSRGALEGLQQLAVEQTFNQFGQIKTMPFDILWTGIDPNTVNTAKELTLSTSGVNAPNAGVINPYAGIFRHVALPYLATDATGAPDTTKSKYFGIASSRYSTAHLGINEPFRLKAPSAGNNAEDFSTDGWMYGVRGGYMIAIVTGDWIKMSKGDGTA